MIDFHSHLLPKMDDGAESVEESIALLQIELDQGVTRIVATPHYYPHKESVADFIRRREASYGLLSNALAAGNKGYPEIVLGAEVYLESGLADQENISDLCIGNSNAVLIELPYGKWEDWCIYEIYKLIAAQNMVPVLAHLERYKEQLKTKKAKEILNLDVMVQVNAESFLTFPERQVIKKWIGTERVDVLGSDTHHVKSRTCKMKAAAELIKKKYGTAMLETIMKNAKNLLS